MAGRSRQEKKNKSANKSKVSVEIRNESAEITQQVVKPGMAKQQRKEVQKAIEAGIALYKKQHSSKQRDYNKQGKKALASLQQQNSQTTKEVEPLASKIINSWLPWGLLVLSWIGFLVFYMLIVR